MTTVDELLASIFDRSRPAFYAEFEGWLRGSRRFRQFATTYHSKIRAKLKNVRDPGGMQDLRAELETAFLLLRVERFTLEYEKYAASKQRAPDFTVTFKTHTPFNVEVRRMRAVETDESAPGTPLGKLMTVLCDKVEQIPPGIINLLWLTSERELAPSDVTRAVTTLRQLAGRQTDDPITRRAADFVKQQHRLSGVVLHHSGNIALWLNARARHPLPPEIARELQRQIQDPTRPQ